MSVYPCMNEVTEVLCVNVAFDSQSVGGKQGRELSSHAKKSQDAAVGALVRMLRTAPPLRQDSSCYSSHSLSDGLEAEYNTAFASASHSLLLHLLLACLCPERHQML